MPWVTMEGARLLYHLSMHCTRVRVPTFWATRIQSMSSSSARASSLSYSRGGENVNWEHNAAWVGCFESKEGGGLCPSINHNPTRFWLTLQLIKCRTKPLSQCRLS